MTDHYGKKLLFLLFVTIGFYLQNFLLVPILSRNLGIETYGIWTQILVAINFLAPLCILALPEAFTRFSAGEEEKAEIARNYYTILCVIIITGLFVSFLFFCFSGFINRTFIKTEEEVLPLIQVASLLIILQALSQYTVIYFRTFQREKVFSFFNLFQSAGTIIFAFVLVRSGYGLLQVIITLILIHLFIFIVGQYVIVRNIGWNLPDFKRLKPFLLFSLPLLPLSILNWVINVSDRYVIGFFLPVTEVGEYSACYMLSMVIMFFYAPFYVILMPKLIQLWERNDEVTLKKVLTYSNKLPLLVCIPTVFGYAVLYDPILRIITGEAIRVSVLLIPIICIGYIFYYIGSYYSSVFSLVKKTKYTTAGYSIGAIANIAGNICLVPVIGIMGAAITTMLTFLIQMAYFMIKSKKFYDIALKWDFLWKCILGSVLMYLLLMVLKPLLANYGDLLLIVCSILIGACVYFAILYLLGVFKKEEIDLIRSLIRLEVG
jgi:O-antigen/teichoic acid export membrane protein